MKLLVRIPVLVVLLFGLTQCSPTSLSKNAQIKFEKYEHDFRELELNSKATYSFTFSNPGETPLVIQNVKTSCGCTVPQWTTKPIKPGKSGKVKIDYDTSHPGIFSKTITVYYNGKYSPETLIIKGTITPANL